MTCCWGSSKQKGTTGSAPVSKSQLNAKHNAPHLTQSLLAWMRKHTTKTYHLLSRVQPRAYQRKVLQKNIYQIVIQSLNSFSQLKYTPSSPFWLASNSELHITQKTRLLPYIFNCRNRHPAFFYFLFLLLIFLSRTSYLVGHVGQSCLPTLPSPV